MLSLTSYIAHVQLILILLSLRKNELYSDIVNLHAPEIRYYCKIDFPISI